MHSEISLACENAREHIDVPALRMEAVRAGSARLHRRADRNPRRVVAALVAGVSFVAVAAAAEIFSTTHAWFDPNGAVELLTDRATFVDHPSSAALEAAARRVDFPVVLPAGLPAHTDLTFMANASNALVLQYNLPGAWRRSNHLLWVILANPRTLGDAPATRPKTFVLRLGGTAVRGGEHWTIGNEEVIVPKSSMTSAEEDEMKQAMTLRARSSLR